jgi:hypothetical protein
MKLSFVIAFTIPLSAHGRLGGTDANNNGPAANNKNNGEGKRGEKRGLLSQSQLNEFAKEEFNEERYLALLKMAWPECVHSQMTAIECKEAVDYDILTLNTAPHNTIRSTIVFKRAPNDFWYNTVAIPMDDNDLVQGRDHDGLVYYDFPWDGSGNKPDKEEERNIPLTELDPETELPVAITGAALDDYLDGTDNRPIAGGRYNPAARSTAAGKEKLGLALGQYKVIPPPGIRRLGPWDCTGMTGVDCCIMIKDEVRDADMEGHAVQCYLDYEKGRVKYDRSLTARRVRIFANHEGMVSKIPRVG